MKKSIFKALAITLTAVLTLSLAMTACSKSGGGESGGGGKTLKSPEALKEYLDSQPVNSPDNPIIVSMTINDPMLKNVADVIKAAGKYVSLNITGNVLTIIPYESFRGCEMLVDITIPASVSIGAWAFSGCSSLTSITIPSSDTEIRDGVFSFCTSLASVTIPSSVTYIGRLAFQHCWSLTSITIPASVTYIGDAFASCGITSVTIPSSVTYVERGAFYNWKAPKTINIQGKANREETIAAGWHYDWDENCKAQINYGK